MRNAAAKPCAGGHQVTRYQMRQRMISIKDDYVIENDRGERVFQLDGKTLAEFAPTL